MATRHLPLLLLWLCAQQQLIWAIRTLHEEVQSSPLPEVLNLRPLIGVMSQVCGLAQPLRTALQFLVNSRIKGTDLSGSSSVFNSQCACPPCVQPGGQAPSGSTYIDASYIKWIEAAGARPVPILADMSKQEVERRRAVLAEQLRAAVPELHPPG